jgi:hypothetical protein
MVKRGLHWLNHDSTSLKLKAIAKRGDLKLLVISHHDSTRGKNLNIGNYALKGLELFGSTIRKPDLPPNANCDFHLDNKSDYSILRHNTRAKHACMEESLNDA